MLRATFKFRRPESGFTLVELLMAVAIIGIITVPLGNALISYFKNTDATIGRLAQSHDAQITAAYFAQDVESVGVRSTASPFSLLQSIETGVASGSGLYPCGSGSVPAAVVRFASDDFPAPSGTATIVRVAYVVENTSGEKQLHRITCRGSSSVQSDIVVAHNLVSTLGPTCSSSCTASGDAVPRSVTMLLTLSDPSKRNSDYVVTLLGQRGQS